MADYCVLARVKQEMHVKSSGSTVDDALLNSCITAASRAIDRYCTGTVEGDNYFASGSVTGEILAGQVDYLGTNILCYPHKPLITSVQSFTYQENITKTAYSVASGRIQIDGYAIIAYPVTMSVDYPARVRVTISYVGGLGTSGSTMPDDLMECCALLAIRFYREAETGVTDQIGVAELSQLVYTKAWPARVLHQLEDYKRAHAWHHMA
jgi:hypothetical protein